MGWRNYIPKARILDEVINVKASDLISEAAALPVEERAMVAESILRTLNSPDPDLDRKWAEAARQRLAVLRSGQVKGISGQEVFARAWKQPGK